MTPEERAALRQAASKRKMDMQAARNAAGTAPTLTDEQVRQREQQRGQDYREQAAGNAGANTIHTSASEAGIGGFFGAKQDSAQYTAGKVNDPNAAANRDAIQKRIGALDSRGNATMTGARLDTGNMNESRGLGLDARGQQVDAASILRRAALGQGPSAAQEQLKQATDRNMAQALSVAQSGRGNPALAMRQAANARAASSQDAASQSAIIRAQEQQAAQAALPGAVSQIRSGDLATQGQDLAAATTAAGLEQDTAKTNLLAGVDQQKARDTIVADLMRQGMTADQAAYQAQIQQNQFNAELLARQESARIGSELSAGAANSAAAGQAVGAAAGAIAAAASDERVKKNVGDGEEASRKFLKALDPKGFDYKDPAAHGHGRHLGVMAQDVERAAPDLVIDDTDGVKKIDIRKALSASLASLGTIDKRLARLEGRRG